MEVKKWLTFFVLFMLCSCGVYPFAVAQQYQEKQESLFSNKMLNPGFEAGRTRHSTNTAWTTTTGFASPTALTRSVSAATGTLLSQDYANCSQYPVGTALAVMMEIEQSAGGTTEFCSVLGSNVQQCVDVGTTKALYTATMVADGTNTCGYIYRTKSSTTTTLTVDNGYLGRNPNVGTVAQATSLIKVTYGSGSFAAGWNVVNATGTVVFGDSSLYNDSNKKFTLSKPGRYEIYGNLNFSSLNAASAVSFYNEAGSHILPTSVVPAVSTDTGGRGVQVDIEVVSGSPQTVRLAGYVNGTTGSLTYGAVVIKYFPTESEQVQNLGQAVDMLGTLLFTERGTCPSGTVEANGGTIPAQYTELIAYIGSTTMPDYRGLYARNIGTSAISGRNKVGPTNPGDKQEDQFQGHRHESVASGTTSGVANLTHLGTSGGAFNSPSSSPITDNTNGTPRVGAETRVAGYGVRPCMVARRTTLQAAKNSVVSGSLGVEAVARAYSGTPCTVNGACVLTRTSGAITAITRTSSGNYYLTFASGFFSGPVSCSFTVQKSGIYLVARLTGTVPSATAYYFVLGGIPGGTGDAWGNYDYDQLDVTCQGPR